MAILNWIDGVFATSIAALALSGCNVFFSTDSVAFGDSQTQNNGTSAAECASSCTCESDCARSCDRNCTLRCETGASCDFTINNGGTVTCEAGSDCNVQCEGGDCETVCEGSCTMHCGAQTGACGWATCEGSRTTCGARGLACDAQCP